MHLCHVGYDDPLIYGDITFDQDELEALKLDPKFAVYQTLLEEDFECEIESTFAKLRWSRKDNIGEEEDIELTEEEQENLDIIDAKSRQPYDYESHSMDMRRLRATDVKLNSEIILPRHQGVTFETQLEVRRHNYIEVFREYVREFCDDKSRQKINLTPAQNKCLKS